jgi:hypothetical protein
MKPEISNPRAAAKLALEIITTANELGITAWIQDGTLLGAVREGMIIRWDTDLDIGIYSWEYTPDLDAALQKRGFTKAADWNTRKRDYHQKWIKKNVKLDIFHYYQNDDGTIYHGLRGGRTRFHYPTRFTLAPVDLNGVTLPAPFPPERFLHIKYGPDWRIPKQRWNCSTDPRNAQPA